MFDDLKNDWKNQKGQNLASAQEMLEAIHQRKRSIQKRTIAAVLTLFATMLVLISIWHFIPFEKTQTVFALLATVGIIAPAMLYLWYVNTIVPNQMDDLAEADKYAEQWIEYKNKTKRMTNIFYPLYMISLTIAMFIYLQEVTAISSTLKWIAYGSVSAWLLYVWFGLAPNIRKKTDKKVDKIIADYRAIQEQIKQ